MGNGDTSAFFWERNDSPSWQHRHQQIWNTVQPPRSSIPSVAERTCPSFSRNVETKEGEWGSVQSHRALLSFLTQQVWDSEKSDMSDKAVTVGKGASWDALEEFSPCYYFLNYECAWCVSEARQLSLFHTSISECEHLVWGPRLPPLEAFREFYVLAAVWLFSSVSLSPWAGTGHRRMDSPPTPSGGLCFSNKHWGQGQLRGSLPPGSSVPSPLIIRNILKVPRADIATSPIPVSLTSEPPSAPGGWQTGSIMPVLQSKKVRFQQLRFFQEYRDRMWKVEHELQTSNSWSTAPPPVIVIC